MKVFIFGAGASRASQTKHVKPYQVSPLTNELVSPEYFRYANEIKMPLFELSSYIPNDPKISLEKLLTERWEQVNKYNTVARRDAAKASFGKFTFYLWRVLQAVSSTYDDDNLYRVFLSKLLSHDTEIAIINFNYDILLDIALQRVFGYEFHNLVDYKKARYVKPHGSINWFLGYKEGIGPKFENETNMDTAVRLNRAALRMYNKPPLDFTTLDIVDPSHRDLEEVDHIIRRFNNQYFYPLMFIPLTIKMYSLIDNFEKEIIDTGKNLLSQASEITFVGYRAADEIIKDLFVNVKPNTTLNVVSLESAPDIMNGVLKWKPDLNKGFVIYEGFGKYVEGL